MSPSVGQPSHRPLSREAVDDAVESGGLGKLPSHVWIRLHDRDHVCRRLRISLTEHCNLACFFCHNEGQGRIRRTAGSVLNVDQLQSITRAAVAAGVDKVKLTGGEPLLFRSAGDDIVSLVRKLAAPRRDGHRLDLSMTTNGTLLPELALPLADAGLDRVTVSLTTLSEETFHRLISRSRALLPRSIAGLRAARVAGLSPLKINTVLYHSDRRGIGNLSELRELVDTAVDHGVSELRFFTLLWHDSFGEFDEFYQFFSPAMRQTIEALLTHCNVVSPSETVEILSNLAFTFAH